jgi:hypothetical protein
MKERLIIFLLLAITSVLKAQPPTNNAEFNVLGKKYTAAYDAGKHLLTFSEELSFEIFDETGVVVKRGEGIKIDFRPMLKKGAGEKTFTVKLYKKARKTLFRKNKSIKQKGEIGTMLVTDSIE